MDEHGQSACDTVGATRPKTNLVSLELHWNGCVCTLRIVCSVCASEAWCLRNLTFVTGYRRDLALRLYYSVFTPVSFSTSRGPTYQRYTATRTIRNYKRRSAQMHLRALRRLLLPCPPALQSWMPGRPLTSCCSTGVKPRFYWLAPVNSY